MTHEHTLPRAFRADLAEVFGEATITLGSPPTMAFARPPYGFTRPLTREELGALAAGRFAADLDAQLRACAPPPIPPLDAADRARIVRLAGEAWIALTVDAPDGHDPEPLAAPPVAEPDVVAPAPATAPAARPEPPAEATVDGTGVVAPDAAPTDASIAPPEAATSDGDATRIAGGTAASPPEVAALPAPPNPRRALTVTLTLEPDGAVDYRALLGVGAEGCDPFFRAIEGAGTLAAILAAVPGILAAAEERWLGAPRYPASVATGGATPAKAPATAKAGAKKPAGPAPTAPSTPDTPATPDVPATKRQIELFG